MGCTSLSVLDKTESLLWQHIQRLPMEYQKDFEYAVYNTRDQRLIGKTWSIKWDGQRAYLI